MKSPNHLQIFADILKDVQLLTKEEFAAKMSVSPKTVIQWIKSGELSENKHFIKLNSVVRFPWPWVLIVLLSPDMNEGSKPPDPRAHKDLPKKIQGRKLMNLDY